MLQLNIKTYRSREKICQSELVKPHFFVLSKGINSGKPLTAACANCFVISVNCLEEKQSVYWITYALWKGKAVHPLLRGSVIPFITIHDYRHLLIDAIHKARPSESGFVQFIAALQQIEEKEALAREQLKTIGLLQHVIIQKFLART